MRPGAKGTALFLSLSAAVFLAIYLLPAFSWPWLGLILLAPAGLFLLRRRALAALICLGLSAGLLWCGAYRAVFFAPAQALDGQCVPVDLRVAQRPTGSNYGGYVPCWVLQEGRAPVKGVLSGGGDILALCPGDRVRVTASCSQTALLPDVSFTDWAARGVFLKMEARGDLTVERPERPPLWCLPRRWGDRLADSIRAAFPWDVSGLFAALSAGDRSGLTPAVGTDLARSGLSHLVALSGMHVCFLLGLLTLLTGYGPRRRLAVCGPVLVLFALAVGGAPSVVRACYFQLAVLTADALGREGERWTTLSGALAFLLVLDPFSAASVSLQLSFAAVVGIYLVTPRVERALGRFRLTGEGRWTRRADRALAFLRGILATTLGAMTFTVPLCAWYYGTVSLAAPLTNLLVLPVASLLFAGGLLTGLLGMVWPAAAVLTGAVLALPGRYVLWIARRVAAVPFSCVPLSGPFLLALAGAYVLALTALFLWDRKRSSIPVLCAAALTVTALSLSRLACPTLTAAVLDVGQGQCVVLCGRGETVVIDCGGSGRFDPGDICADYLAAQGRIRVDRLILTHLHADHAGGVETLLRRLKVREVILPRAGQDQAALDRLADLAGTAGAKVTWLAGDTSIPFDRGLLRLYAPQGGGDANEMCLAVLAQAKDFSMLVTGDMDTAAEQPLAARADLPRCQMLVAGHHGAADATGPALLNAVSPECVVISAGRNNPYGHPDVQTLERLKLRGVTVYRTDTQGTVTAWVP